ncbi:virulence RhuM family protein [Sulfurimonas sp. NW15]|uniref:virulence RhuM family protein n=1 Tax=Sulfurimonas sp. NW15 TaxID=2922729 RepID=UPI003DA98790
MENIVVYSSGELEIKVSVEEDSIWLTTNDVATLFSVQRPAIVKHINNIYKSDELSEKSTCSILEQVAKDGKKRKINYYNLDMIISVGYRVNSKEATHFRQWATKVLKEYISNGYAVNREKITQQRLLELEKDVEYLKSKVKDDVLEYNQGIFFDGQIFDAYEFIATLIKSAKKEIKLIDNYIDESVLTLFSKNQNIKVTIYTKTISKQLKLDLEKYNSQYNPIEIKKFENSHDRFLIIDEKEIYHIGASLKDLGKKWFAFSKIDSESLSVLERLKL